MQLAQRTPHRLALADGGEQHALAREPAHQRGRLAVEGGEVLAGQRAGGHGTGVAARGEVIHEAEEERQVVVVEPLEEREHPAAVGGIDEVVGVFHPLANALVANQLAHRVGAEKGLEFGVGNFGEDRHGVGGGGRKRHFNFWHGAAGTLHAPMPHPTSVPAIAP